MLYGPEPSTTPATQTLAAAEEIESTSSPGEFESEHNVGEPDDADTKPPTANAGAKKTAVIFGIGLLAAIAATAAVLATFSNSADSAAVGIPPVATLAIPASSSGVPPPDADHAIAYTASADCPAGSTSAQALSETASDSAWVCVRGAPGARVDGQVLHLDLRGSYVISAVSVTPGWVAKTRAGKDEWLQHRVVSRIQYVFNDDQRTVFTQDTGNTHGPVTTALPVRIVASHVTVVILQTARPPASPLPAVNPTADGQSGFGDSMLGPDAAPLTPDASTTTDPVAGEIDTDAVDATFAMSTLKILGHQPN